MGEMFKPPETEKVVHFYLHPQTFETVVNGETKSKGAPFWEIGTTDSREEENVKIMWKVVNTAIVGEWEADAEASDQGVACTFNIPIYTNTKPLKPGDDLKRFVEKEAPKVYQFVPIVPSIPAPAAPKRPKAAAKATGLAVAKASGAKKPRTK